LWPWHFSDTGMRTELEVTFCQRVLTCAHVQLPDPYGPC
jgi:hypothetical protein